MLFKSREVRPGPSPRQVLNEYGLLEAVPSHWALLPPGDPALSRRIKLDGPSFTVVEAKGRKRFSRGIWAPADRIGSLRQELTAERLDPSYERKLESGRRRRAQAQDLYAEDFRGAIVRFLNFHPQYRSQEGALAGLIAAHAVPVGSGTVARTERIPIEERASAATIAWMRHQTTGYDQMKIKRVTGRRREMRRLLAQRSTHLLAQYRSGHTVDMALCPLHAALERAGALKESKTIDVR
jgi:hypothetical protein